MTPEIDAAFNQARTSMEAMNNSHTNINDGNPHVAIARTLYALTLLLYTAAQEEAAGGDGRMKPGWSQ